MAAKKSSGASIPSEDPDKFILVGDKKSPLYDRRILEPLDEALVMNIMVHGVLDPVHARRNGPDLEIVDGRRRILHCREANRRLKKQGSHPHVVRYLIVRGSDAKVVGVMASTFLRKEDSLIGRAEKMQQHLDLQRSEEDIAIDFGCTVQTVRSTVALLDCAPEVTAFVEGGGSAQIAKQLAKLPRKEQVKALAELQKEGAVKGAKAHATLTRVTATPGRAPVTGSPMLGKKPIVAIISRLKEKPIGLGLSPSEFAAHVLEYVIGNTKSFEEDFLWHATGEEKKK